jgi:hypothetical protein
VGLLQLFCLIYVYYVFINSLGPSRERIEHLVNYGGILRLKILLF